MSTCNKQSDSRAKTSHEAETSICPLPDFETGTHTQGLSRDIDAAYEDYRAGEPEGEDRLYQAFKAQAANVLWHRLESPDQALAHDISTKAMLAVKSFRGESLLSTWFYRIAQNEAKDALRTKIENRKRLVPIDVEDEEINVLPFLAARPANLHTSLGTAREADYRLMPKKKCAES